VPVLGDTVISYYREKSAYALKGKFGAISNIEGEVPKYYIEFEDGDTGYVPSSWVHAIK
jgi:oxalate decarboxylase/phosphoglucose isomerase-like protein (cupin superfamily)